MGNKLTYPEVNLSGKVALVTGGNTGIGYETAKGLARFGAHTFIACRSKERAQSAIERMKKELLQVSQIEKAEDPVNGAEGSEDDIEQHGEIKGTERTQSEPTASVDEVNIEYLPLDLSSFQSTKECVKIFEERDLPLHILINNAAVASTPYGTTEDNFELQFQINHLGPVLFTLELLPVLLDTAASCKDVRVLFLTSNLHHRAQQFNVETLNQDEQQYKRMTMYNNTKLYNIMSGYCLQRRLQNQGITVSSVHPGFVRTELTREAKTYKILYALFQVAHHTIARTPKEGAATSLYCAVNPELNSQQHFYYDTCATKISSAQSRNEDFQEQLWKKTFDYLKEYLSPEVFSKYGPKVESLALST